MEKVYNGLFDTSLSLCGYVSIYQSTVSTDVEKVYSGLIDT